MEFARTAIPDVVLVTPRVFSDARGFFMETWEQRKFAAGRWVRKYQGGFVAFGTYRTRERRQAPTVSGGFDRSS